MTLSRLFLKCQYNFKVVSGSKDTGLLGELNGGHVCMHMCIRINSSRLIPFKDVLIAFLVYVVLPSLYINFFYVDFILKNMLSEYTIYCTVFILLYQGVRAQQ